MTFREAVRGLLAGDFSRLAPLFEGGSGARPQVVLWHEEGAFSSEATALAEAVTCAAFNGCVEALDHFLSHGLDPSGGIGTGLNAVHWAANRGQLAAVERLLQAKPPLETLNSYGGTALECAVWSAIHEPKPGHLRIIEILLDTGARAEAAYPSGDVRIDEVLQRYASDQLDG